MKKLLPLVFLLAPLPALALTLSWPLACTLGKDCFVQNYVDRDPGAGMTDYTCGSESYENAHDGTDIRLRTLADMRAGVAVLAAADGTVTATRDEMEDISIESVPDHNTNHRDCGNAVLIKHGDGYDTMYCHLRQGSVAVKKGDVVRAGQKIGEVGLSGQTDFPHLHFSLHKDRVPVDPFDGQPNSAPCGKPAKALWQAPVPYVRVGLINDGILDSLPDKHALRDTAHSLDTASVNAPMLAYWADLMNLRSGDVVSMRLMAPDGTALAEHAQTMTVPQAFYFNFIGRRFHAPLAPGQYRAELGVTREAQTILKETKTVTVN